MHSLRYESGQDVIELDGNGLWVGTGGDLRASVWDFTLGYRNLAVASRNAREAKLSLSAVDPGKWNYAMQVFSADVQNRTPGVMWWDGWTQRAYVLGSAASLISPRFRTDDLTVALLDGVWRRGASSSFMASVANSGEFLNYPHSYPYDYSLPDSGSGTVENSRLLPAPVSLTFWGPVANPAVTIGGNRYACDITVDAGARLEVDGIAKTITLIDQQGNRTNVFSSGRRGSGEDGGEYIFERIPSGAQRVSWSGGFGFDLTVYEESMEVPWSIS
jgi:hypothetical protein